MRTFLTVSALAAMITTAVSSCGNDPTSTDHEKPLVYEGSMAEPQIGEQHVAEVTADSSTFGK